MNTELSNIWSATHLKRAVTASGSYFFSPATMRFFNSRLCKGVIHSESGLLFVTSEQYDYSSPRLYTVRILRPDYSIDEVGEFQQYATSAQAWRAARAFAKEEAKNVKNS